MEIRNHGKNLNTHFQKRNAQANTAGDVEGKKASEQVDQANPQRLLERLEGDTKVRARLLVEIKAKFEAGEYQTSAAAMKAAEQIVE